MTTILLLILIFLIIKELLPGTGGGGGIIPRRSHVNIKISVTKTGLGTFSHTFKIEKEKLYKSNSTEEKGFQLSVTPYSDGIVLTIGYSGFEFSTDKISFDKLAKITKTSGVNLAKEIKDLGLSFSISIYES